MRSQSGKQGESYEGEESIKKLGEFSDDEESIRKAGDEPIR